MEELINGAIAPSDFKEEIIFIQFKYVEIRDLLKHFLTLISASLVFSLTFSEKIIDFQKASLNQKLTLYISWGAFILALGFCGYGLHTNYLAAEIAIEKVNGLSELDFSKTASCSDILQKTAAILYGIGLTFLISSSLFKMKKAEE